MGDPSGRIAVAGATGYLGGYVVRALYKAGWRVRALTRSPAKLADLEEYCHEVVVAEATEPGALSGFCDDCQAVYIGLGLRSARRKPTFWEVDRDANLAVLREAERADVGHVVFVAAQHADRLATRGVAPARAREAVVEAVERSGRRWTVVRGTGFFNDMAEFFHMAEKGRGWVVGDGSLTINPIHGADLAEQVVACFSDEARWNKVLAFGGPETFTFRALLELAFETLGKPPKISAVPAPLLTPARYLVWPFNPTLAGFLHAIREYVRMGDATAPACGTHTLGAFFEELAAGG